MINIQQQLDLKKLIKSSKYTQKQLAKRLSMSEQWLSKIVNKDIREVSIGHVEAICSALDYKVNIIVIQV